MDFACLALAPERTQASSSLSRLASLTSLRPSTVIRSDFFRDFDSPTKLAYKLFYPLMLAILKTENEGAQTTLHCALMPYKELVSGGYYSDCAIKPPTSEATLDANITESWRQTIDKLKSLTGEQTIFGQ